MRFFFIVISFIITGAALADPPMKTVSQSTSSTTFGWYWPFQTTQTRTSTQTHAAPLGSAYKTSYGTSEDVSKYRFHNSHLTYQNQWGYFFPPGTKPVRNNGAVLFTSPQGYFTQSR